MKFTRLIALLATVLIISSCEKDGGDDTPDPTPCPTATYPVSGMWIGTYSVTQVPAQGNLFYSFNVYPDGSIVTKGKGGDGRDYYSTGTWTLSSTNIFTANIVNANGEIRQRIIATFSTTGTMTNATWSDTVTPYNPNSGAFSTMQRIN